MVPKPKDLILNVSIQIVDQLINPHSKTWEPNMIWSNFSRDSVLAIFAMHFPSSHSIDDDDFYWIKLASGMVTSKSAYNLLCNGTFPRHHNVKSLKLSLEYECSTKMENVPL